jgi:hypothetical protein
VKRLMFVALSIEIGLVLLVIPWSAFWERNYFAQLFPPLHGVITNHFVRGAVSGIGLINLSVGLAELVSMFTGRETPRHVSVNPSHLAND